MAERNGKGPRRSIVAGRPHVPGAIGGYPKRDARHQLHAVEWVPAITQKHASGRRTRPCERAAFSRAVAAHHRASR